MSDTGPEPQYGEKPTWTPQPMPQQVPPYGYGYPPPGSHGTSGKAITALVCGIASIPMCGFGFILGIVAIVFGILGRKEIDASRGAVDGRGMAIAGLICGIVGLVISLVYIGFTASMFFIDGWEE